MKIYEFTEATVKREVPPSLELEYALATLQDYAARLRDLTDRMSNYAERVLPHNGLCANCNDFKADCRLVEKETLCGECREVLA